MIQIYMDNNVKISVITVAYNVANEIEQTIKSVIGQTYKNIEYIVIDGGSTDGTVDIIKRYADRIHYWVSEPDKGIYNAMNKALRHVTGDYVNFMNAGDWFADENVVSDVFGRMVAAQQIPVKEKRKITAIYGDTYDKYVFGYALRQGLDVDKHMLTLHCFSHQSVFIDADVMKAKKYDEGFRVCADANFFYQIYVEGYTFKYVKRVIAVFDKGGLSSASHATVYREHSRILGRKRNGKYHMKLNLWRMRHYLIKLAPKSFINRKREQKLTLVDYNNPFDNNE
ncbi:MAG: glycosyltransferase family 2 protein [Bacteroidales bacterium]|nr:glycosyltransferase family 2 protein [Bacteroidales bacterium]